MWTYDSCAPSKEKYMVLIEKGVCFFYATSGNFENK